MLNSERKSYNVNRLNETGIPLNPNQITFNGGESVMASLNSTSVSKICTKCGENKNLTSFPSRRNNDKTYYESTCNWCKQKAWREKNRDKHLELRRQQDYRARARKAGITVEEYLIKSESLRLKFNQSKKDKDLKVRKCQRTKCPVLAANPKLYYLINKEKKLAQSKNYYWNNLEKARIKTQNWKKNNPAKKSAQDFRRRTRFAESIQDLTNEQWEAIKQAYSYKCAYCGKPKKLTQDHVIPVSKGGNHTASNIVPACQSCNSSKHAALIRPEWMHEVV